MLALTRSSVRKEQEGIETGWLSHCVSHPVKDGVISPNETVFEREDSELYGRWVALGKPVRHQ